MCSCTWKKLRCLSRDEGLPVGGAMPVASPTSISVERLLKERLDLLEDGGEKTRESCDCELKDPRCSLDCELKDPRCSLDS